MKRLFCGTLSTRSYFDTFYNPTFALCQGNKKEEKSVVDDVFDTGETGSHHALLMRVPLVCEQAVDTLRTCFIWVPAFPQYMIRRPWSWLSSLLNFRPCHPVAIQDIVYQLPFEHKSEWYWMPQRASKRAYNLYELWDVAKDEDNMLCNNNSRINLRIILNMHHINGVDNTQVPVLRQLACS